MKFLRVLSTISKVESIVSSTKDLFSVILIFPLCFYSISLQHTARVFRMWVSTSSLISTHQQQLNAFQLQITLSKDPHREVVIKQLFSEQLYIIKFCHHFLKLQQLQAKCQHFQDQKPKLIYIAISLFLYLLRVKNLSYQY